LWQGRFRDDPDPVSLYARLRETNPAPFAALIRFDAQRHLLSSSPERLIELRDGIIETRPIAGTHPRGASEEEDRALSERLLGDGIGPRQALHAVFPGGTITGCPKVRCMQIIRELEDAPRGVYTGSLGYISDHGRMDFNILIRSMDGVLLYGHAHFERLIRDAARLGIPCPEESWLSGILEPYLARGDKRILKLILTRGIAEIYSV